MTVYDFILSRRSIRQFKKKPIPKKILMKLVNAARLAPSAANLQPMEFVAVNDKQLNKAIFSCLRWAAYISPKGNPQPGQEPTAYIVVLVNTEIKDKGFERDSGAALENVILTAWEEGIGSCWIISIDRSKIHQILSIPDKYKVDSILALGYSAEQPVIEEMKNSVKYWKDKDGQLHVPKRKLEDIFHFNKF